MQKIWRIRFIFLLALSVLTVSYLFPVHLEKAKAQQIPSPLVRALETSLESTDIYSFVEEGFNYAVKLYGQPRIPVQKVFLGFSSIPFTVLDNADTGEFTINLLRRPSEYSFHGQLAHEIGHLLNARLFDCYAEGLSTLFAEKMLNLKGLDWSRWEKYYRDGYEPFYGLTYLMMKEVADTAGMANMERFLSFVVYNDETKKTMRVDIDGWLSSMSDNMKSRVKNVINRHLAAAWGKVLFPNDLYSCQQPS